MRERWRRGQSLWIKISDIFIKALNPYRMAGCSPLSIRSFYSHGILAGLLVSAKDYIFQPPYHLVWPWDKSVTKGWVWQWCTWHPDYTLKRKEYVVPCLFFLFWWLERRLDRESWSSHPEPGDRNCHGWGWQNSLIEGVWVLFTVKPIRQSYVTYTDWYKEEIKFSPLQATEFCDHFDIAP